MPEATLVADMLREVQPRLGSLCRLPTALARCDPARPARIAVVGPASAGNASVSELPCALATRVAASPRDLVTQHGSVHPPLKALRGAAAVLLDFTAMKAATPLELATVEAALLSLLSSDADVAAALPRHAPPPLDALLAHHNVSVVVERRTEAGSATLDFVRLAQRAGTSCASRRAAAPLRASVVTIVGDSWGGPEAAEALQVAVADLGLRVNAQARPNAQACLLGLLGESELAKIAKDGHRAPWGVDAGRFVLLSAGINDLRLNRRIRQAAAESAAGACMAASSAPLLPPKWRECVVGVAKVIAAANPAAHIVSWGYDSLCATDSGLALASGCGEAAAATPRATNAALQRLQATLEDVVARRDASSLPPEHAAAFAAQRAAGGSWTSVNLQGTLQERGSLAVDRWSERRYFAQGDCLHPAPPGLARLMAALKSRHFEPLRRRELRSYYPPYT